MYINVEIKKIKKKSISKKISAINMGKPLGSSGGFLWQLERKRKYYMSMHMSNFYRCNSRAASTALTAVTFSLCLLLYVNLWSTTRSGGKNSMLDVNSDSDVDSNSNPHHLRAFLSHPSPRHNVGQREFSGQAQLVTPSKKRDVHKPPEEFSSSGSKNNKNDNNNNNNNLETNDINVEEEMSSIKNKKESVVQKLERIFKRVDVNKNGLLSAPEISKYINEGIKSHFSTALATNFDSFFAIDRNPRNGRVEWEEYLDHYFKSIDYKGPTITADSIRKRTDDFKKLAKNIKVDIAALEAKWSETASNDPEFLTVDEFLAFTHAEASPTKLLAAVQDTFSTFDLDGDGIITKTEFDTTYAEAEGVDNVYKEDLHLIDTDGNSKISRVELMRYMDPKNTLHSDKDAATIIKEVDGNGDAKLSMKELKDKLNYVTNSKLYDIVKNLHNSQMPS